MHTLSKGLKIAQKIPSFPTFASYSDTRIRIKWTMSEFPSTAKFVFMVISGTFCIYVNDK